MTFTSYPAKGLGGMDASQWSAFFAGENGIINDYTGNSCSLTRVDASNLAQIGVGKVRVGGYVLDVTATHDLTVSTSAATYYIWACYDPALNVPAPGGAAIPPGHCTLGISSGAPSTAGSKIYVLLYQIVRSASQALTAATVNDFRTWTGPTLHIPATTTIPSGILTDPETAITGFQYPVGARLAHGGGTSYLHIKSTSGLKWAVYPPAPTWINVSFGANWRNFGPADQLCQYTKWQGLVFLRGMCEPAVNKSSEDNILQLPTGYRPPAIIQFKTGANDAADLATSNYNGVVSVDTDGTVRYRSDINTDEWVNLTGVTFFPA